MREVCRDVKIEPGLLPVENPAVLKPGTNITKGARLDISGMGVWNSFERSYLTVMSELHTMALSLTCTRVWPSYIIIIIIITSTGLCWS